MIHQQKQNEAVVVARRETGDWAWSVVSGERVQVEGRASDPASAYRTGAFAAGAVDALSRIGRRR